MDLPVGSRLAQRMGRLGTESAFDVLLQARQLEAQGRQIIHLEIGEPDFPTPPHIAEAGERAIREGHTKYGPPAGLPALREAIAAHTTARLGVPMAAEEVVVTPGAKPILFFAALALLEPGDEVVYPDPGFPIYGSVVEFLGARPMPLPLRATHDFRPDPDELRELVSDRTKLIILNSPENPTGGVLQPSDLESIAELALEHDAFILSDEIYSRLVFEGDAPSLLALPGMRDRTIVVDGFSKTYAMTGWRLGYGVMHRELAEKMALLQVNCTSCTASFVQHAGLAALEGPQDCVDAMLAEFRRRRDFVADRLTVITGFSCAPPAGAFYCFPDITATGLSADEVQHSLLHDAGVAVLSGAGFGPCGAGHVRLSFATNMENLETALDRIGRWAAARN